MDFSIELRFGHFIFLFLITPGIPLQQIMFAFAVLTFDANAWNSMYYFSHMYTLEVFRIKIIIFKEPAYNAWRLLNSVVSP